MQTDVEIAQAAPKRPISEIAAKLGLAEADLHPYGNDVAKVDLSVLERPRTRPGAGRLVLVSAITPTPAGEGKTTTSIGLRRRAFAGGRIGVPRLAANLPWAVHGSQGRRGGGRLQPGDSHGAHQPALHRGFPRHHFRNNLLSAPSPSTASATTPCSSPSATPGRASSGRPSRGSSSASRSRSTSRVGGSGRGSSQIGSLAMVGRSDRYVDFDREFGRLVDDLVSARGVRP